MTGETLRDLVEFHGLKSWDEGAFKTLVRQIERLVNAKFIDGRLDESGELWIRAADLLRYGFCDRSGAAA
jgi:hypothetical protein